MGEQVFDARPFVVYRSVRPKKTVLGKIYTGEYGDRSQILYSGTFTVDFSCYEPYGYLKYKAYDTYDNDGAGMYCGILEQNEMPDVPDETDGSFLIYNPGTEVCNTLIRIGGTTGDDGLTIKNITNETQCVLSSLPQDGYLEIDSDTGAVIHVDGDTRMIDFQYHNSGFLTQEPYGWNADDLVITTTSGSASVTLENKDIDCADLIGKYLRVNDTWLKIVSSNENTIVLASTVPRTETLITKAVSMNEIEITGADIVLSQFSIDYYPMIK